MYACLAGMIGWLVGRLAGFFSSDRQTIIHQLWHRKAEPTITGNNQANKPVEQRQVLTFLTKTYWLKFRTCSLFLSHNMCVCVVRQGT